METFHTQEICEEQTILKQVQSAVTSKLEKRQMRNRTTGFPKPRTAGRSGIEWLKPYYLGWQKALHISPQLLVLPVGSLDKF